MNDIHHTHTHIYIYIYPFALRNKKYGHFSRIVSLILLHWCLAHPHLPISVNSERVTHICTSKLSIIGSDNCLSAGRQQTIIWTNAGTLLIRQLGTNSNAILIKIHTLEKSSVEMTTISSRPQFVRGTWLELSCYSCIQYQLKRHVPLLKTLELRLNHSQWHPWWRHQNGNIFRVTGPLCGEFTGHRWSQTYWTDNEQS